MWLFIDQESTRDEYGSRAEEAVEDLIHANGVAVSKLRNVREGQRLSFYRCVRFGHDLAQDRPLHSDSSCEQGITNCGVSNDEMRDRHVEGRYPARRRKVIRYPKPKKIITLISRM